MNLIKYGFTNQFVEEAAQYQDFLIGRVIAQHKELYNIVTAFGEQLAELSGKLRYETTEFAKLPTVGDFVMVARHDEESNAIIHRILTRKSVFLRKSVGVHGQAQPIAANIDTVFVCMSLNNNFNLNRLERYLSVAWDSGAQPVVVLTKADLCENLNLLSEVEQISMSCQVIPLSMFDKDIGEKLSPFVKEGTTAAFIGSSGVGKSTLINILLGGGSLLTRETGKEDKGKHTTTGRQLYPSPFGGVLIDTPGMRELGIENADVSKTFSEIEALAQCCKFKDCTHNKEPGCAVLKAVEDGALDQRRLDSYFKLQQEADYEGLSSREIENKKLNRMFKDVGGLKGARRFAKNKCKKKQ